MGLRGSQPVESLPTIGDRPHNRARISCQLGRYRSPNALNYQKLAGSIGLAVHIVGGPGWDGTALALGQQILVPRRADLNHHRPFETDSVGDFAVIVAWAPTSLQSKMESWVAVTPIVTVFLGSVERRFSVPAVFIAAVARSLGQAWPQATGEAGAQRA
jgi:hypothetical protein